MTRDTMTAADALWRIAELASRSSDPRWRGDRRQAMTDLEAAISEVAARLVDGATGRHQGPATNDEAGARVGPARGETDRERALASRWEAEAAEARAQAAEARTQAIEARQALARCQAALQAAGTDRDEGRRTLRRAHQELSTARAAVGRAEAERDKARAALAAARSDLAAARSAQEEAEARQLAAARDRFAAEMERDTAISVLNSGTRKDIDLRRPGTAPEEPGLQGGPEEPRVLAGPESSEPRTVVDLRTSPDREFDRPRLLHVAATLGRLLPEDLAPLLRPGVQVVRREGRLAALLAMPVSAPAWGESSVRFDEEQAEALRAAGLRVAWSSGGCLAS